MKKITATVLAIFSFVILPVNTAKAAFSDLDSSHSNYNAILYLQENGILSGYSDGTFRPDQNVNRAEFLKIILEGSNITLDITTKTPFSDVDESSWYAPYLKKAYNEGWIDGYPDGTFKPDQSINKVESLKILGEVQSWELSPPTEKPFEDVYKTAWYTPYVSYAKDHNFLEETGLLFVPDKLMTRAGISEVIYRTLNIDGNIEPDNSETTPDSNNSNPDTTNPEPPDTSDSSLNFTPVNFETVSANFFTNVTLEENFPNTFYKNELFIFEGNLNSSGYDSATLIIEGQTNAYYRTFTVAAPNNTFSIPVHFQISGNYNIGIMAGASGETKAVEVSVLPSLPEETSSTQTLMENLTYDLGYKNDQTYLDLSAGSDTLKKFNFVQGTKSVTYLFREKTSEIPLDYRDFENFSEDKNITVYFNSATLNSTYPLLIANSFSENTSKNFTITEHTFSEIDEESLSASLPDSFTGIQEIKISAKALAKIAQGAYVIKPDGLVDEVSLQTSGQIILENDSEVIPAGNTLTFSYLPETTGRYIIEINNTEGIAVINHPIYIGKDIPLIPDFFDLNTRDFFDRTFNLSSLRTELLNYINDERETYNLNPVSLDTQLSTLAQNHSEDMAENNYFSHYNLQGQSPDDRRVAMGLNTPVSENIAQDTEIDFAHYGLMRSAAHRSNILTEEWENVGLGIALQDGYLFVTEEFASDAISAQDLVTYKNDLFESINNLRENQNENLLVESDTLDMATEDLNDKQIDENLSLTNEILLQVMSDRGISGLVEVVGRISASFSESLNSIIDEETTIIDSLWQKIGIDLQTDTNGILYVTVMLQRD